MTISDTTRTPDLPAGFDVTDPAVLGERIPFEEFAELRRNAPVWWCEQPPTVGGFQDEGFWVVTRHEEVKEVSQRSDIFSTHENTAIPRFADDIPRENVEMQRFILINKDAPEHTKLRKLVSRGFTPRAINSLREELTERAEKIVTTAAAGGAGDFVVQVASELPLQAIAELLGVPQEDRMKLFDWSNQMTSYDDPEFDIDDVPLDDPAVFALLGRGDTMGVFQLESPPMRAQVPRRAITSAGVPLATMRPPSRPEPGPRSTIQSARRISDSSCSTTITVLPMSRRRRRVSSRRALSRWCRPIEGSSSTYMTPVRPEPICDARRIRCASPPDSVSALRSSDR